MFDRVDTAFSYERELIACSFLHDFSKAIGSSLQLLCNAHTTFLRCGVAYTYLIWSDYEFEVK